jgi:Tfp pilus assembly major pilin PilA
LEKNWNQTGDPLSTILVQGIMYHRKQQVITYVALITRSKKEIEKIFSNLEKARGYGLRINEEKTKYEYLIMKQEITTHDHTANSGQKQKSTTSRGSNTWNI